MVTCSLSIHGVQLGTSPTQENADSPLVAHRGGSSEGKVGLEVSLDPAKFCEKFGYARYWRDRMDKEQTNQNSSLYIYIYRPSKMPR